VVVVDVPPKVAVDELGAELLDLLFDFRDDVDERKRVEFLIGKIPADELGDPQDSAASPIWRWRFAWWSSSYRIEIPSQATHDRTSALREPASGACRRDRGSRRRDVLQ
jgi:hypothetical protein